MVQLHDILIIGAGPCGLAVAARLREQTPSAIFTDSEHQRYHWINKHKGRMNLIRRRPGKMGSLGIPKQQAVSVKERASSVSSEGSNASTPTTSTAENDSATSLSSQASDFESEPEEEEEQSPTLKILDSTGPNWLTKWHRAFRTLEIAQLRSPMFFHVDPSDRDGMLAYTTEQSRESDLWEIPGCVGKEISKHKKKKQQRQRLKQKKGNLGVLGDTEIDERDRKDYFSPGTALFRDFCESVVGRYGLDKKGLIEEGEVADITYGYVDDVDSVKKVFTVATKDGSVFHARAVVLAVGPGGKKIMPFELSDQEREGACHSSEIRPGLFPSVHVKRKIQARKETNLVVVGGGLSSAQIVDMAIRKGVSKVWFLMRSDFKVKHFDITLTWMGKFKNYEKAVFWSADTDEERLEMIKTARGGGSITPRYQKILQHHASAKRVSIHTRTTIASRTYNPSTKTWHLTTNPPIPDFPAEIDHIYFATGMHMDVNELPFLQKMHSEYPIRSIGGLPCLTDDLMWQAEVPLYMTGRLAALRLGPGAPNLEGARLGAERVAWSLEEVLGRRAFGKDGQDEGDVERSVECFCGLGNRYARLAEA
ncbi:FAD binding domain protein [Aspergillus mulundensis]|uniref:L-ornithine N(5)-monooxygenase n=1 Tax=Aspergillus mulundensis TaxID=1810919 RepID=A0A3D8SJ43_9EURO|nr:hypothetical protein DSM5745_03001 [Aspergillus mulundensis]RDW86359.1 hypothetical protein DSM5745_03001 [Aspergillus mulundensis]